MVSEYLRQIRHFIYQFFLSESRPPTVAETAVHFHLTPAQIQQVYQARHDGHFLFLNPGTTEIRMANPLSAVPTDYQVRVDEKAYWANCAWDMLGIPAMLKQDVAITAVYADTRETAVFSVQNGRVHPPPGVIHFPLPFQRWYDNLIHT